MYQYTALKLNFSKIMKHKLSSRSKYISKLNWMHEILWIPLVLVLLLYFIEPKTQLYTENKIINTTTQCVDNLLLVEWDSYDTNYYHYTGSIDFWEQNVKWKIDSSNVKCETVDNCTKIINKEWNTEESCFNITKAKYRI